MAEWLLKLAVRLIAKRARRRYGGPGERGEEFNTANFRQSCPAAMCTGMPSDDTAQYLLRIGGFCPMTGGCHWVYRP